MKNSFNRLLILFAAVFFTLNIAKAEDEWLDVVLGETLSMNYESPKYKFTPQESGFLFVETDTWTSLRSGYNSTFFLYNDPEGNSPVMLSCAPLENENGWTYIFDVEAGVTYYFFVDYIFPNNFTFTMGHDSFEPGVNYLYPECGEDKVYPILTAAWLEIAFVNFNVDCDGIKMYYQTASGEKSIDLQYQYVILDMTWLVNLWNAFQTVRHEILDNSIFRVEIINPNADGEPIKGKYIENGNVVLRYRYLPLTNFVSESWPQTFLSYWPADEEATARIVFSAPLLEEQPQLTVSIYGGNDRLDENGMPRLPDPTLEIQGNTLTLHFEGVRRECKYDVVSIFIHNILDAYGMPVNYNGGYNIEKQIPYRLLEEIDPVYEWTPGPNAEIKAQETLELWISNDCFDHFKINGFEFITDDESEIVPFDNCQSIADEYDPTQFTLVYVPVPEFARNSKSVSVNPILKSLDGYDYDLGITYLNQTDDSGIAITENLDSTFTVFNLQGIRVMSTDNHEDIFKLPKGFYILNGKLIRL